MKHYLGDGVYVEFEDDRLILTCDNDDDYHAGNRIVLETDVYSNLVQFVEHLGQKETVDDHTK